MIGAVYFAIDVVLQYGILCSTRMSVPDACCMILTHAAAAAAAVCVCVCVCVCVATIGWAEEVDPEGVS